MTADWRVGIGHDTHRLAAGGGLRLGGVDVPHDRRALGHSDADVLLHAVTDAVLGAAALGDIGELFPDSDPANAGRDSGDMLRRAWELAAAAGWELVNLDCIVHAQRPKLTPYKLAIRQRIAELLAIDLSQVGLKAKTGEGVGPVGREEAIQAECVVLVRRGRGSGVREEMLQVKMKKSKWRSHGTINHDSPSTYSSLRFPISCLPNPRPSPIFHSSF